jgi:hypothetical protein
MLSGRFFARTDTDAYADAHADTYADWSHDFCRERHE